MAFIETIPPHAAEGDVRAMYERQQAAYGYVPNYAKVFCHRPEIMGLWAALLSGLRRHVDRRRFELVTVAAAQAMRHSYCSLAHGKALTQFFSADEIRSMLGGADPAPISAAEAAMMNFARKIARDAATVTAEDVAALARHGFTDAEIFDIAGIAAGRAFFAKLLDALGAEADAAFLEMDEQLRGTLTLGRPIDRADPECVPEAGP